MSADKLNWKNKCLPATYAYPLTMWWSLSTSLERNLFIVFVINVSLRRLVKLEMTSLKCCLKSKQHYVLATLRMYSHVLRSVCHLYSLLSDIFNRKRQPYLSSNHSSREDSVAGPVYALKKFPQVHPLNPNAVSLIYTSIASLESQSLHWQKPIE